MKNGSQSLIERRQTDRSKLTDICLRLSQSVCVEEKRDLVLNLIVEIPRHADAEGTITLRSDKTFASTEESETDAESMHRVINFLFPKFERYGKPAQA